MQLLKLNSIPIFEQLRLEEALLRTSKENWCIINTGSSPAIVMGISGHPEKLLDLNKVRADNIPVIKRFSGGGTVYVDPDTIFVTFICNQADFDVPLQPNPILQWSEQFYKPFFKGFSLRENDYVFGEKKFGGNAQYIQKSRWLLHTSFLWDYSKEKMQCLLLPTKRPKYRQERTHEEFLCTLRPHFPNKNVLVEQLVSFAEKSLKAKLTDVEEAFSFMNLPHRRATQYLSTLAGDAPV